MGHYATIYEEYPCPQSGAQEKTYHSHYGQFIHKCGRQLIFFHSKQQIGGKFFCPLPKNKSIDIVDQ